MAPRDLSDASPSRTHRKTQTEPRTERVVPCPMNSRKSVANYCELVQASGDQERNQLTSTPMTLRTKP